MASMIGIGVAVDYSLFVVVRFREELRDGATLEEARARPRWHLRRGRRLQRRGGRHRAGRADAGPDAAIRSMAFGAIVVVLVSMLACATLLPALLAVAGPRIGPGKPDGAVRRWSERVTARPALSLVAARSCCWCSPRRCWRAADRRRRAAPVPQGQRDPQGLRGRLSAGPRPGRRLAAEDPDAARRRWTAAVKLLRADPEVVRTGVRTLTTTSAGSSSSSSRATTPTRRRPRS